MGGRNVVGGSRWGAGVWWAAASGGQEYGGRQPVGGGDAVLQIEGVHLAVESNLFHAESFQHHASRTRLDRVELIILPGDGGMAGMGQGRRG